MHRSRLPTVSAVVVLVASEIAALRLLLLLGRVEGFAVDWSDPAGWVRTADTADLLAAAGRLVGIGLAAWLVGGTLASLARRAVPAWREVQGLDALSLPLVRRTLDRLMAVSLGASALLGPAATASASTPASSVPASNGRAATGAAVVVVGTDSDLTVLPMAEPPYAAPPDGSRTTADGGSDGVGTAVSGGVDGETLVVRAPEPRPSATTTPGVPPSTPGVTARPPAGEAGSASSSPSPATSSTAPAADPSTPASPQAPTTAVTDPAGRRPRDESGALTGRATPDRPSVVRSPAAGRYTIRPGDSLWLVAERHVASHLGGGPGDEREVARYWLRLVDENRATLRSGNPGLVYAGEIIVLPPLPA